MVRKQRDGRGLAKLFAVLIALVLVAAACGSGDDDSSSSADADADETEASTDSDESGDSEDSEDSEDDAMEDDDEAMADDEADGSGDQSVVSLGIFAECQGAFGGFNNDIVAGAIIAMALHAGATVTDKADPLAGFTGASAGGTDIELVGIACGDDTGETAVAELRKLVEQDGANVVVGPLSGDESVAMAEWVKDNPGVTIINGTAGAQETTLQVQAPNFFRFNGDGAQWNAGIGDILHNTAGWETAAVIADDYSFGLTSAAGFIAEFCAAGGVVTDRVFPPLNTTDYSSFVQQLPDPDEVDGYFWVVGGSGTQASLEAFVNLKGDLNGEQHAGNLFFNPGLASALGTNIAGAYVGGFATLPGDVDTPEIAQFLSDADTVFDPFAAGWAGGDEAPASVAMSGGFGYSYYVAGLALVEALNAVDGDLANNQEALRAALSSLTLDAPYGAISLDENRQAIIDASVSQLVLEGDEVVSKTVAIIPGVDQTFGGTFSPTTPAPSQTDPSCEQRDLPWIGNAIPVVDGVPQR